MNKYRIEEIYGDGYERWAKIKGENNRAIYVHFIEYDEYLENNDNPIKRKKGDIIIGNLKIDLVTEYKVISNDENGYIQNIEKSSNITARVKVKKVEDTDEVVGIIKGLGDDIIIEFEDEVEIEIDTMIEIKGSLEIDIE